MKKLTKLSFALISAVTLTACGSNAATNTPSVSEPAVVSDNKVGTQTTETTTKDYEKNKEELSVTAEPVIKTVAPVENTVLETEKASIEAGSSGNETTESDNTEEIKDAETEPEIVYDFSYKNPRYLYDNFNAFVEAFYPEYAGTSMVYTKNLNEVTHVYVLNAPEMGVEAIYYDTYLKHKELINDLRPDMVWLSEDEMTIITYDGEGYCVSCCQEDGYIWFSDNNLSLEETKTSFTNMFGYVFE